MFGFTKKSVPIFSILAVLLMLAFGFYWYTFHIGNDARNPRKASTENLKNVLRPEFLPGDFSISESEIPDVYGDLWEVGEENFSVEIAYNSTDNEINYFSASVNYEDKIDLNENLATELVQKYFLVSDLNFLCDNETFEFLNYCKAATIVDDGKKIDFAVIDRVSDDKKINSISVYYVLRPKASQRYDETNIWLF